MPPATTHPSQMEHFDPRSGQFDCPVVEHSVVGPPLSVAVATGSGVCVVAREVVSVRYAARAVSNATRQRTALTDDEQGLVKHAGAIGVSIGLQGPSDVGKALVKGGEHPGEQTTPLVRDEAGRAGLVVGIDVRLWRLRRLVHALVSQVEEERLAVAHGVGVVVCDELHGTLREERGRVLPNSVPQQLSAVGPAAPPLLTVEV